MEITLLRRDKGKERFLAYFISTTPTHNFCKEYLSSEFRIMLTLKAGANSYVHDDDENCYNKYFNNYFNYFKKHHFQSTTFLRLLELLPLRS